MRSNRTRAGAAAALVILIVACATAPTRDDQVTARAELLRAAVTDVASDPAQRGALLGSVDAMETALHRGLAAADQRNREFFAASSDPDADRAALRAIVDRNIAERRAALRDMMTARIELRRDMTPEQWRVFAEQLPAFDGGLR